MEKHQRELRASEARASATERYYAEASRLHINIITDCKKEILDLKEAACARKEESEEFLRESEKHKFDWELNEMHNKHKMKGMKEELARSHLTIEGREKVISQLKEEKKSLEVESFRKEQEKQAVSRERLLQQKKTLDLKFERERNLELNIKLASSRKENDVISSQLAAAKIRTSSHEATVEQWKKIATAAQKKMVEFKKRKERKEQEDKAQTARKRYIESLSPPKKQKITEFANPLYDGGQEVHEIGGCSVEPPSTSSQPGDMCAEIVDDILKVYFRKSFLVVLNSYFVFRS